MGLDFSIVDEDSTLNQANNDYNHTVIKVVGCGGGGSNAVNRMISRHLEHVEFIVVNTDLQALNRSNAHIKLPIGQKVTKGLGAGGKPSIGEQAAEEDREAITDLLRGADMVFISAGMGGGTGTGSAPIIAKIARDLGCLTVAVVTTPFEFEGRIRMKQALEGLEKLHDQVDSLIVIPNEQLFKIIDNNTTVQDAFKMADEILCQGVEGISNIITKPGDVNTDFADVRNAMSGQGNAIFGIGVGEGENRAVEAAAAAINNPMLENSRIDGAKNILVNICASEQVGFNEVREICKIVSASADEDYNMFWGQVTQPELGEKISVTVIATGFESNEKKSEESAKEEEATNESVAYDPDFVKSSELDDILNSRSGGNDSRGGVFISVKDVKKEEFKSAGNSNSSNPNSILLTEDSPDNSRPNYFQMKRPDDGYNGNDLTRPAIWSDPKFGKTIKLDD